MPPTEDSLRNQHSVHWLLARRKSLFLQNSVVCVLHNTVLQFYITFQLETQLCTKAHHDSTCMKWLGLS